MSDMTPTCPQILGHSGPSPGLASLTSGVAWLSALASPAQPPPSPSTLRSLSATEETSCQLCPASLVTCARGGPPLNPVPLRDCGLFLSLCSFSLSKYENDHIHPRCNFC